MARNLLQSTRRNGTRYHPIPEEILKVKNLWTFSFGGNPIQDHGTNIRAMVKTLRDRGVEVTY